MKAPLIALALFTLWTFDGLTAPAQDQTMRLRVQVVLVELDVAVTDAKGNYISGLKPEDFLILEDNRPEKIMTFEEGFGTPQIVVNRSTAAKSSSGTATGMPPPDVIDLAGDQIKRSAGSNLFILFDTSNYMYRSFVFAQDSIAEFVRSLEGVNQIAFYSYSRDLSRVIPLTSDRSRILHGVRETVAGDNPALYNGLLMTVKDAAPLTGRKAIIVFSNGPDTESLVPPEDISELAQSTGTMIYIISTRAAQAEPISSAVFERITKATGGKAYFAKDWQDENHAFSSIRDDLAHLYTLSYYPQPNANQGFRKITVKLVGKKLQHYHIRTREGYRLLHSSERSPAEASSASGESRTIQRP